jgi:hypothetical protein
MSEASACGEREAILTLLREHLGGAATKHYWSIECYCTDPQGCIGFDEAADLDAWQEFEAMARALLANDRALKRLPPDGAARLRAELEAAANVLRWRIATHRQRSRRGPGRSWHAVTVVAVCRALWVRWKGAAPPRTFGNDDAHPFLDFVGDALAVVDARAPSGEAASPRGAIASWAKVASAPELDFDFTD